MKQLNYLICMFLILSSLSCKSIRGIEEISSDQASVITDYFKSLNDDKLFFKSIVSPSFGSKLSEYIHYDQLNATHDLRQRKFGANFETIFTPEEIERLRYKAHTMRVIKFGRDQLKNVVISKKWEYGTLQVSIPIISSDKEYALLYVESIGGGEFIVFKKINDHWKITYVRSIWIS